MIFHNLVEAEEFGSMGFPAPPQFKAEFDAYRALYRGYQFGVHIRTGHEAAMLEDWAEVFARL